MLTTSPHLSMRTNDVNMPAGEAMELFCLELGERLRKSPVPVELSAKYIARCFLLHFDINWPVMSKLGETLDLLGISWLSNCSIPTNLSACYIYDRQADIWEIQVRDGAPRMESVYVMHELYEILWWRCYYLIPEWRQWAAAAQMSSPHTNAEDFARAVVLPQQPFETQAVENGYNPVTLAAIFQTAPGYCFQSLLYLTYPLPYIQLRIDLDVKPDQSDFCFDEQPLTQAQIMTKGTRIRPNASKTKWTSMFVLQDSLPKKNDFVSIENWISKAVNEQRDEAQYVSTLFAVPLPKPVYVVVRHNYKRAFIQIVPVGKEEMLHDATLKMHRQAAQAMALERLQN